MKQRFAAILVALMVLATLLSACSSDSKDAGKDYMEAVLKGDEETASALACDSFDGTPDLIAFFRDEVIADPETVDIQVDLGKTNNQNQLRVTGSVDCARSAMAENCNNNNEFIFSEKRGTLIILEMEKEDGEWCVSGDSEFEGTPLAAMPEE